MRTPIPLRRNATFFPKAYVVALFVVGGAVLFTIGILDPLWTSLNLTVPGEPHFKANFTNLVDSIFYVRNVEEGYQWMVHPPTSIWFHPLLVWLLEIMPLKADGSQRFWILSLGFAYGALLVCYRYTNRIIETPLRAEMLYFVPLLPGGIGIATGNAEFPCLFFTGLLSLSIIERWSYYQTVLWGALAILTKPNALYMLPFLAVYVGYATLRQDKVRLTASLLGLGSLCGTWVLWIWYVDSNVGYLGAYWDAREIASVPLTQGMFSFLYRVASAVVYGDIGEKLKFTTALIVPLVDMWLLQMIHLKREEDRTAILLSLVGILLLTFMINNPNKIIVYATTIPGHIAIGLIFLKQMLFSMNTDVPLRIVRLKQLAGFSYIGYCIALILFYIWGTPYAWYY